MKTKAAAIGIAAIVGIGVCVAVIANSTKPVAPVVQKHYAYLMKNGDVVQALPSLVADTPADAVGIGEIHTIADPEHPDAFREFPQVTARACYDRRTGELVSNKMKTAGSIQCGLAVFDTDDVTAAKLSNHKEQ